MALVQLAGEHAAGLQGPGGPGGQRPEQIEPIGAPVQSERRLEVGHLARNDGHDGGGHVGRVGNHGVEGAHALLADAGSERALQHGHTIGEPQSLGVFLGERHRL